MAPPDWIDPESAPLEPADYQRLEHVETFLARGLALKAWWFRTFGPQPDELTETSLQEILRAGVHPTCFRLIQPSELWPENMSYGFLDRATIRGHTIPVVGRVQQVLLDRPMWGPDAEGREQYSAPAREEFILTPWRNNVREFVWSHLLSTTSFSSPHVPYVEPDQRPLDPYLEALSWRVPPSKSAMKWGGAQNHKLYYRRRDNQKVGRFWRADHPKISLHDLESEGPYLWIVLQTSLAGSKLDLRPPGPTDWIRFRIPLAKSQLGVMSQHFLHRDESPGSPDLGRYSFGWSLSPDLQDNPAYAAGFSRITFQVRPDGRILLNLIHVTEQPPSSFLYSQRVLSSLFTSARLLDSATRGWTGRALGISPRQLQRQIMTVSAIDFSTMVDNLLYVWRAVSDWTCQDCLPDWVDP